MPSNERPRSPAPSPGNPDTQQRTYQAQSLPEHKTYGPGRRYTLGNTKCDVYTTPKAEGAFPLAVLRTPRSKMWVTGLTSISQMDGEKEGILLTTPTTAIWVKDNGSYVVEYVVPDDQAQTSAPSAAASTPRPTGEPGQQAAAGAEQKEKQRVKASGFFGKVLDNFPRETEGEEKRRMYKFLIGNKAAEQPDDGKEKIDWITVVAHAPHVVKYLDEHVDDFKKRETRLNVEGYYQEFETTLRRSGRVKKTQELYALSIQVKEEQQ